MSLRAYDVTSVQHLHKMPSTFFIFLIYLILSYLILSYLILSYLILSYLILSYLILSYLGTFFRDFFRLPRRLCEGHFTCVIHFRELKTTATTTTTPQNNRFDKQKQSPCTCVQLHFGTFLCRPLQNNNLN